MNSIRDPKVAHWLETNGRDLSFLYIPDLFTYPLNWTALMAERCYDLFVSSEPFAAHLSVEPSLFEAVLRNKSGEQRLLIYGGFLYNLKAWQGKVMLEVFRRFPFTYNWEGRLREIVYKYQKAMASEDSTKRP